MARNVVLVSLVAAAVMLAGCASLDALTVAGIPSSDRPSGWSPSEERSDEGEVQAGPLTIAAWKSRVLEHGDMPQGAVAVVTVSDVPLYDESGPIKDRFAQVLEEQGVSRSERRTGELSVVDSSTEYTLYDADIQQRGATVQGFVLEYTVPCGRTGTVVGFLGIAATRVSSSLGSSQDPSTWEDVAGSNWESEIGGMATSVVCEV